MHKILEKIDRGLKEYEGRELTSGMLDAVQKMTDIKKNILKIEMLEGGGYSEAGWEAMGSYEGGSSRRYSRNSYDGGSSYRSSYEGGNSSRRRRDSMGRYSRSEGGGHFIEMLEEAMENAPDERSRKMIRECMEEMR